VPRLRPDRLPRARLVRRLEEASSRELLLVSAPPGFGKSTLLADWARGAGRPVAWLSLDSGDNDPARFWGYLAAALEQVRPGLRERVLPLLQGPDLSAPDTVVAAIVNELAAHPGAFSLVLDDYHAIDLPAVHEGVGLLIERMPPGLHLVLAGRSEPPLALASMRAGGQLAELRAQDLRFTPEEAGALLREAWGLDLSDASVVALTERTEGWAAGLQLAALSLRGASDPFRLIQEFTGSHRYVLDYLTEEVLERQPDDVRSFLLETSILERLTGPLCDAVTSRSDGQLMLESLERSNLFLVALDEERRWYRYHRLFADLLQVRLLERDGEGVQERHRRAAAWSNEHGLVDEAVRHAIAGRDAGWAARIVERHVDEVMRRGEGATLRSWLSALPPEVVRARPGLCLVQAIAAFNAGQFARAESLLDDAERALTATGGEPESVPTNPEGVLATVAATVNTVRAALATARGATGRARTLVDRAVSILAEQGRGPSLSVRWNLALADWMDGRLGEAECGLADIVAEARTAGVPHLALTAGASLARVQRAGGRLSAALRTYREGLELGAAASGATVPTTGESHVGLAEVLYERDQLDDALHHAAEGVRLCRQLLSTRPLGVGLAALARIRQATGDPAGAADVMDEADRLVPGLDVVSLYNPVPARRARLLLAQGKLAAAADWVDERGLSEEDEVTYAREAEYLVLVRLLLARGVPDRALRLLARLCGTAEAQDRNESIVEVRALEALALGALGDRERALSSLSAALAVGRPEGFVRVFADEGRPMAALLAALATSGRKKSDAAGEVPADYLDRVLRAAQRAHGDPGSASRETTSAGGLVEPLTGREQEVLERLASGRSNREIAIELVVTLETVKKHVTHILEKLGAANRTQAVALARGLGLISD
jgi:LuxR family maltose regulon positive regulatory protein